MLRGSINHIALTVSDLEQAMTFMAPLLERLGFTIGQIAAYGGTTVAINVNVENGSAVNLWQAKGVGADHPFAVYEPGLHHVAFNVAEHEEVDAIHAWLVEQGGVVLEGPAEFPYADDGLGYYAVYFLGPDGIKIECVHMPGLERAYRDRGLLP